MTEKQVNAGEIIFMEGDVADVAYVVVSGNVDLIYSDNSGRESKIGVAEAGKAFGELAIFDVDTLRPYTARAASDVSLQSVSIEEFQSLFAACPETIKPLLLLAFERLAPTKSKIKTPLGNLPKGDIAKITVSPASDNLKAQFRPVDIAINALPFRIGGYPEDGERNRKDQLSLAIATQKNPLLISRQHCEITLDEHDNIVINDLGSRFCTIVNGVQIGRGRGLYSCPLKKGDNDVYLGGRESKYKLVVNCS